MGQLNLPATAKVYLDSVILIYSIEAHPNYRDLLQPLWLKLKASEIEIISSELSLLEVLVLPLRNNDTSLVDDYREFLLGGDLQLIPISQNILTQAARLRAATNLRTPDAIHLATALDTGSTAFITNGRRIRQVSNLSVIVLQDLLES